MPPEDEAPAVAPASPEERARATRHRRIILISMGLLILAPVGAALWLLLD